MGIEIDPKYGGAGSTFFAAMLAIEELAKVTMQNTSSTVMDSFSLGNTQYCTAIREYSG